MNNAAVSDRGRRYETNVSRRSNEWPKQHLTADHSRRRGADFRGIGISEIFDPERADQVRCG